MNPYNHVSVIAQTEDGQVFDQGVQNSANNVIAINRDLGLLVLAHSTTQGEESSARKAVEILLDDMQLNLPSADNTELRAVAGSVASQCLRESFENINEYLHQVLDKSATLVALQFTHQQVSCLSVGNFCSLMFSHGQLHELTQPQLSVADKQPELGLSVEIDPRLTENKQASGDIFLMTTSDVLQAVGKDHIRLTLSRFQDNLDMALRQINTRAARSGMEKKPPLILFRVEQSVPTPQGWLNKLRNRQKTSK